jgi:Tfp pilus assembly protein FimT
MKGRVPHSQRGLSLVEVLGALAIAAVLMVPLAALFQGAADSGVTGRTAIDLNADLRFALDRIAARAAAVPQPTAPVATPPQPAPPAAASTTMADASSLLAAYTYTLSPAQGGTGLDLVETDPTPKTGHTSVIASNVQSFRVSTIDIAAGQPLVKIDLTLSANGASASGARIVRLWGPQ